MFLDKGLASLREKLYLKLVNAKNRNLVDPDKTLGGVMEMAQSLPGVMQTLAVTVRQFEISSTVCSRFCHACPLQYKNLILQCSRHAGQEFSCAGAKTCGTKDGSVVAWGDADFGGGSSAVRDQLKGAGFCPTCPQQYKNLLLQCIRGTGIFLYWCKDMRDERWIRRCLG